MKRSRIDEVVGHAEQCGGHWRRLLYQVQGPRWRDVLDPDHGDFVHVPLLLLRAGVVLALGSRAKQYMTALLWIHERG